MNIPLRNKQKEIVAYTRVSQEHFQDLNKYRWYKTQNGYVQGTIDKKQWTLHRYIKIVLQKIELQRTDIVDHINNDPLDNTLTNLRIVTVAENNRNKPKQMNTKSKFIGVTFDKRRWAVKMVINDTPFYASYINEEHAGHQYNLWCKEHNLFTAKLNVVSDESVKSFVPYEKAEKKQGFPKGIDFRRERYRVRVMVNNKTHYVGEYKTYQEAVNGLKKFNKEQEERQLMLDKIPKIIVRNELNIPIIELFNKDKVKVGETLVDEDTYFDLIKFSWSLSKGYVKATNKTMHRYIMNYEGEDFVDHINGNPLDNRKCNLRITTVHQNGMNKGSYANSTSKYIGVRWDKSRNKWTAAISMNGISKHLGRFENEIDAAKARDEATKIYFKEHGRLNFP